MREFGVVIGTYAEIEAQVRNAFMGAPNRSEERRAEIEGVAQRFIAQGERVFWWGRELYIVSPEGEDKVTPEQIGSILMGYLS